MKTDLKRPSLSIGRRFGGVLKTLAVAATVALALSAQAATKRAKVGNYTWTYRTIKGGKAYIGDGVNCAISPNPAGAVTVPTKFGDYKVTLISDNAFKDCNLTSVKIQKGVKTIGASAFEGCIYLKKATLPSTLTTIRSKAFGACRSLTSVTIPDSVTSIGSYAFANCTALASVSVPKTVTTIKECTFCDCTSLTDAVLAEGVTDIESQAFRNCTALSNLTLPRSLTSIGSEAFAECRSLEKVRFSDKLKSYFQYARDDAFRNVPLKAYEYFYDSGLYMYINEYLKHAGWTQQQVDGLKKTCIYLISVKTNNKSRGTVSGKGWFANKSKATIKATAKKGYVFCGWYRDELHWNLRSLQPTLTVDVDGNDVFYALFLPNSADKAALTFSSATKKLSKTATAVYASDPLEGIKIGYSARSLCTIKAKGLPQGLYLDGNTIKGTPTVPGKYTASVTVKSAGGNTITQKVKINVLTPTWVRGTFYGCAKPGTYATVQFTVDAVGGVSCKFSYKDKSYSTTVKCSYADRDRAEFSLSIKLGSLKYNAGKVTIRRDEPLESAGRDSVGVDCIARNAAKSLKAQKVPDIITSGLLDDAFIGRSVDLSDSDDESGLAAGKINMNALFKAGGAVTFKGKINGRSMTSRTGYLVSRRLDASRTAWAIELAIPLIAYDKKYYRELCVRFALNKSDNTFIEQSLEVKLFDLDDFLK